jgi:large subunit ribosomal protein L22
MKNNNSMTATLKYALTSDKKMVLLAKFVQGKKVDEALRMLEFTPKRAAKILHKVITSATANAVNNVKASKDGLFVETVFVGRGPKIKRMRFASRSRAHHYVKHRSFVKVVLNSK